MWNVNIFHVVINQVFVLFVHWHCIIKIPEHAPQMCVYLLSTTYYIPSLNKHDRRYTRAESLIDDQCIPSRSFIPKSFYSDSVIYSFKRCSSTNFIRNRDT